MSTPMIDRAMAQAAEAYRQKPEERVLFDSHSKENVLRAITHSLECLLEDDPQPAIRAALEAVRAIK